jgi:hypothetical protein
MSIPTQTRAATRTVRFQGGGLRFLDALAFRVVTRPLREVDDGQHWLVTELGDGVSTIRQVTSGLFLAAAADGERAVLAGDRRTIDSVRWRIEDFGGGFASIEHVGSGRYLEATIGGDFGVVIRSAASSEQTWRLGDA